MQPGEVQIRMPPRSLYAMGGVVLHDMERRRELCRADYGGMAVLQTAGPLELGIAWGRGNTPPVKLRFRALPGRRYALYWLREGFGAGLGVKDGM